MGLMIDFVTEHFSLSFVFYVSVCLFGWMVGLLVCLLFVSLFVLLNFVCLLINNLNNLSGPRTAEVRFGNDQVKFRISDDSTLEQLMFDSRKHWNITT
jgi:hypothetical protein